MNVETLIAKLTLPDEADRSDAAEDLGYSGAAEAIAPLVARLTAEPSHKVRETIFGALERIDHPEVLTQMAALLDSDDAFIRNQAVALLQRKGAAAAPVLLARMNDADPDVRKFVVDAAAGISLPVVDAIFAAAMRDADPNVVIAALEHVGAHRMGGFKPAVEEIFLNAKEPMLVCAAFASLLEVGDAASWRIIRQRYPTAASVPAWELGWWIRALGEFGAADEIGEFHKFLQSHDDKVARDTIDALERFQVRHGRVAITDEFWALLRKLLQTNLPPEDELQLLRVVGGFSAPPVIGDYLMALLEHDNQLTRLGAIEGLKRLGRPDLMERLRNLRGAETDAEVAEALAEC
jgi:HEAT repeat protein